MTMKSSRTNLSSTRIASLCALALATMFAASLPAKSPVTAAKPTAQTSAAVLAAARPGDWRTLDPQNTLYLDLPNGRVIIELAPAFAPNHIANIKALAREQYYDGLFIVRAQDNYVVQMNDPDYENEATRKPIKTAKRHLAPEFTIALDAKAPFTRLPDADGYAPATGFSDGFASARDPNTQRMWL